MRRNDVLEFGNKTNQSLSSRTIGFQVRKSIENKNLIDVKDLFFNFTVNEKNLVT
jgi:hypothetical protein